MKDKEIEAIVALLADNAIHQMTLADMLHEKGVISRVELGERIDKFTKSYYEMIAKRLTKDFFNMTKGETPPEADEEK